MWGIPRVPLILGLLGLLPVIWGAGEVHLSFVRNLAETWLNSWFYAPYATLGYASSILMFMSGVLFGFAARARGATASMAFVLSVLPVLYTFFLVMGDAAEVALKLAVGFVLVLGLDLMFHRQNLTPEWWIRLRVLLTIPMVACLLLMSLVDT